MRVNENGIAVPSDSSPLPWELSPDPTGDFIADCNGGHVMDTTRINSDDKYIVVSANFHERMADIVRRLAKQGRILCEWDEIVSDAALLWTEYQEAMKQ